MITKFEKYRTHNPRPNDYVICKSRSHIPNTPLSQWLETHIGQVVGWYDANTKSSRFGKMRVIVEFDNLPEEFRHVNQAVIDNLPDVETQRAFPLELIEYCSPNKDELEMIIQANKYDL